MDEMTLGKAKNLKGTAVRLFRYLRPQRKALTVVLFASVFAAVAALFIPRVLAKATAELVNNINTVDSIRYDYITYVLVGCIGLYTLSAIFSFIAFYVSARLTQGVVYSLRRDIKLKLDKLPISFYDTTSRGDILSRVNNDIETVSATLQEAMTQILTGTATLIGVIVMMFLSNVWMALVVVATVPFLGVTALLVARYSKKVFVKQQQELGLLNGHVEEMYGGHQVIKLYGRERASIKDFDEINYRLRKAGFKAQGAGFTIMPLMNMIGNIGYVALIITGGYLATSAGVAPAHRVGVPKIQEFIMYRSKFNEPITQIANIANIIQSTIAAAERVFELFDVEEESDSEKVLDKSGIRGEVKFNNVSFSYTEDKKLIENLNISVKAGSTVAIVGPTGAGKTTLVNLLMRFYDPNGGTITVDGHDITEYSRESVRDLFGMVLQDTWLRTGTIAENIAFGNENATREEIIEACKKAHAHHFIATLPQGYDTVLDEDTSNISQGQRQLLTIARAIIKEPKIIILDEATSSVDTRTEEYIQTAMTGMMVGKTSFVIAHRLSTIKNAEHILVMRDGSVIEQGNHLKLLADNGFYAEMYNAQYEN